MSKTYDYRPTDEVLELLKTVKNPQLNLLPPESTRTLLDGTEVPEYPDVIDIVLKTHCPAKYLIIDAETGQVWQWHNHQLKLIHEELHVSEAAIRARL